ncbi:MAG: DNA/RNA nuclease SfsA [Deltaproteobacteria bacterium]|nr:DNA/RNA nuclease SfsA [Deltaproteobacteria bacterium]
MTDATLIPWPAPAVAATFVGRRQRFFADVRLSDGSASVAHCANTGSMAGLLHPGGAALLGDHGADTARKLRYTLLALQVPSGAWCGVLPVLANRIGAAAVRAGWLPELGDAVDCKTEQPLGDDSRVDLWVDGAAPWAIEVKSATLVQGARALFPDAKTDRGRKHLQRLAEHVQAGGRAAQLYVVQRDDADSVAAAVHIDPEYAAELERAKQAGVQVWALGCRVEPDGVAVLRRLPVF